jgi:DNA-binding CsgD family transcriptional regulator
MTNDQLLENISNKLSAVLLVLLSPDIESKNIAQKVEVLTRLNLPNQEIADIVGTTRGTVGVLKSRSGKKHRQPA